MTKQRRQAIQRVMTAAAAYAVQFATMIGALDAESKTFDAEQARCLAARTALRRVVTANVREPSQ